MKKRTLILVSLVALIGLFYSSEPNFGVYSASAAPTSTIVQSLIVNNLKGSGSLCLHVNNSGYVSTSTQDCGAGIGTATTSIAGLTDSSFVVRSTSTLGISTSTSPSTIWIGPDQTYLTHLQNGVTMVHDGTPGGLLYEKADGSLGIALVTYDDTNGANDIIAGAVRVDDDTYSDSWSGSLKVPTKSAVWNKLETIPIVTTTDYILVTPNTQTRNTIQPTADISGLTLKKYYSTPTEIQPDALSTGTLVGWWIGDDYTGGSTWADHGPNGYNLTGYSAGTSTLNGHKTIVFNGSGYFQNTSGFTISPPYVVFAVVKANYSGSASPGGTFVASGQSPYAMLAQYYEAENLSPGFAMYSGTGWSPIDKYGTVGLSTVVVAKFNSSSSYIRSGGNSNTTGDPGTNSMTGITIGNGYNYLAGVNGAVAEVVIVTSPSDAEIVGIEGYLANKYNLELASNTQMDDMMELKTGVGDSFWRLDANGTIVPKLLSGSASALDVGVFSDTYPKFRFTPARIEIGDGTYDVEGQTGLYQKGWEFNAPTTVNGNFGFISKSNYIDQEFQVRPPGNSLFSINTGTYKMVLNTGLGGYIGPAAAGNVALDVRGFSGQTANIQNWSNSGGTPLTVINKDGYLGIGTSSPSTALQISTASSTLQIGSPTKLSSCIVMQDMATTTYSPTYNYVYSGAWVSTTTKPSFCQ